MKKVMIKLFRRFWVFACCFLVVFWLIADAETKIDADDDNLHADSLQLDSLFYKADSSFFSVQDERIKLISQAEITYHTSKIEADVITIDVDKNQAIAEGKAMLTDKDQIALIRAFIMEKNSEK